MQNEVDNLLESLSNVLVNEDVSGHLSDRVANCLAILLVGCREYKCESGADFTSFVLIYKNVSSILRQIVAELSRHQGSVIVLEAYEHILRYALFLRYKWQLIIFKLKINELANINDMSESNLVIKQLDQFIIRASFDSLIALYDSASTTGIPAPNKAEFVSYYIMYKICSVEIGITAVLMRLSDDQLSDDYVTFAIAVVSSVLSNNYHRFFALLKEANIYQNCVMLSYVNRMRLLALERIVKSEYKLPKTLQLQKVVEFATSELIGKLLIENDNEAFLRSFLQGGYKKEEIDDLGIYKIESGSIEFYPDAIERTSYFRNYLSRPVEVLSYAGSFALTEKSRDGKSLREVSRGSSGRIFPVFRYLLTGSSDLFSDTSSHSKLTVCIGGRDEDSSALGIYTNSGVLKPTNYDDRTFFFADEGEISCAATGRCMREALPDAWEHIPDLETAKQLFSRVVLEKARKFQKSLEDVVAMALQKLEREGQDFYRVRKLKRSTGDTVAIRSPSALLRSFFLIEARYSTFMDVSFES